MKTIIPFSVFALVAVLFSSCANLAPLTETMAKNNNWTTDQLKHIQFYLSDDITLQRKVNAGNTEIAAGKVKMVNGEKVEEVFFRAGTPGILMGAPDPSRLEVSFEDGDNRYLVFVPNPDRGGKYVMAAADWKNDVGKISYDGRTFYCTPESGKAYLEIDLKKLEKVQRDARVAHGRKIDDKNNMPNATPAQ